MDKAEYKKRCEHKEKIENAIEELVEMTKLPIFEYDWCFGAVSHQKGEFDKVDLPGEIIAAVIEKLIFELERKSATILVD